MTNQECRELAAKINNCSDSALDTVTSYLDIPTLKGIIEHAKMIGRVY
jgi:hypothetical protein